MVPEGCGRNGMGDGMINPGGVGMLINGCRYKTSITEKNLDRA